VIIQRFLGLVLIIAFFQACSLDDNTVAKVGDFKITKDEFKGYLANRYGEKDSYESIDLKDKENMLNNLIIRKQKLNEAYDMGLNNNPDINAEYNARKWQMLANIYYVKNIVDRVVSDSLILADFEKKRYEVDVSHVLISFAGAPRSMNNRSKKEAFELAKMITKKVRSGSDISTLALQYSDDRTKMENKGHLGYFTWGRMVDEFQAAAYNLKENEVSEPVLSDFGYHVIYLHDRRENPNFNMANLDKQRDDIKKRLYYTKRDLVKPMWDKHLKNLKKENNYKILGQNIKEFSSANIALSLADTLSTDKVKDKSGSVILAEWDDGNFSVNDLMDSYMKRYNKKFTRFKSNLLDSLALHRDVDQLSSHIFVAQVAEEKGYEDKELQKKLDDFLEFSLVKLAEQESVKDKIDITDKEMEKYYSDKISEFTTPERIEMWKIFVTDEKKANQIYGIARKGQNFEKLAKKFSEDKSSARNYGRMGFKLKTSRGIIIEKGFEAGPNQVLKPFKYNNGWIILKTGDKKDEIIRSYEKSKRQITGKIRTNKIKEKLENWEAYLSEKYPSKINTDLLPTI